VEQARAMLIAAAREMIAAYRQLKASLRYSRISKLSLARRGAACLVRGPLRISR